MRHFFLLATVALSQAINAQEAFDRHLRFWTKEGIIEKQMEQNRKKAKIKKAYVYKATENWEVADSAQPQYIYEYDGEGRITTYTQFPGAGDNYQQHTTDSFLYDKKGNLKEYSVTDIRDGKVRYFHRAVAETNAKGQLEKVNYYTQINNPDYTWGGNKYIFGLSNYYVFEYDSLKRITAVKNITAEAGNYRDVDHKWKIEYGKNNRVKKTIYHNYWGGHQVYENQYNKNGLLTAYTEYINLEQDWRKDTLTTSYLYDTQNRLEKRTDEIAQEQDYPKPHGCQYWYKDNAAVPFRMLDEYEKNLLGVHYIKDHLVYKFEYYK